MAWVENLVALNFYQDFVTISFSKKKKKKKILSRVVVCICVRTPFSLSCVCICFSKKKKKTILKTITNKVKTIIVIVNNLYILPKTMLLCVQKETCYCYLLFIINSQTKVPTWPKTEISILFIFILLSVSVLISIIW